MTKTEALLWWHVANSGDMFRGAVVIRGLQPRLEPAVTWTEKNDPQMASHLRAECAAVAAFLREVADGLEGEQETANEKPPEERPR